jgi:ABC-2 type transport system ATP-binding protein
LGRRLFRNLFASLKQQGKTVFFSTHIIDDVESLCTDVLVLSGGMVSYKGPINNLVSKGFDGTDLTVSALSQNVKQDLQMQGYSIKEMPDSHYVVFVPPAKNVLQCQKYLADQGIFCNSIERRNISLEDLLYTNVKAGTNATTL